MFTLRRYEYITMRGPPLLLFFIFKEPQKIVVFVFLVRAPRSKNPFWILIQNGFLRSGGGGERSEERRVGKECRL